MLPRPQALADRLPITLVIGGMGSGKTWWLMDAVDRLSRSRPLSPVLVHDPKGQWGGRGYFAVSSSDAFLDLTLDDIPPHTIVVIDEATLVFPPGCKRSNLVRRVLNEGRHANLAVFLATQRPRDIHPAARNHADRIVAFRPGVEDSSWYKLKLGIDPTRFDALQRYQPLIWGENPQGPLHKN